MLEDGQDQPACLLDKGQRLREGHFSQPLGNSRADETWDSERGSE